MDEILFDLSDEKKNTPSPDKSKSAPKIHLTGGRGKKQCLNDDCGVFVGVRNKFCPKCGAEFGRKPVPKKGVTPVIESKEEEVDLPGPKIVIKTMKPYDHVVTTPAGRCPIHPPKEDLTTDEIILWAEAVREWALDEKKEYLTGSAIIYYARHFFGVFTDEHKLISSVVTEWDS